MAVLLSDITSSVRDHLSDFPADSDARVLRIANDAHTDIVRRVRIYPLDVIDLNALVAGTPEYALDPDVFRIWSATYMTSANDYNILKETSIDELDIESLTWRNLTPSRPYSYYDLAGFIGLVPTPDTATSAGYPLVRLQTTKRHPFTSVSDALPTFIPSGDAWVYDICVRWALRQKKDQVSFFAQLAKSAIDDLSSFVLGRLVRQNPSARAAVPMPNNL